VPGLKERAKRIAAKAAGVERPSMSAVAKLVRARKPDRYLLQPSGRTPNNPSLPLMIYRQALKLQGFDPAWIFEVLFDAHGWRGSWRNGMYNYNHFHTRTHEVLGIARGAVVALFGGAHGQELELKAGDVVVIPAGVGHRRIRMSRDLLIVGAYPSGGRYDEPRPSEVEPDKAAASIAATPKPATDPVYAERGALLAAWR
jgi:uncharacterized protein YjlB